MSSPSSSKLSITVKKRKPKNALKKRQTLLSKSKNRQKATPSSSSCLPSILQCKEPSILTIHSNNNDEDSKKNKTAAEKEEEEEDEFPPLPDALSAADDIPCDSILAIRSLIQKRACCHIHVDKKERGNSMKGIPFVLRPMIHYTLFSSTSSATGAEHNQILSSNASTGVSIELDDLARENKIRLLRLHGTGDGGEDDIAVMETQDYIKGVWDAFYVWSNSRQLQQQNDSSAEAKMASSSSIKATQMYENEKRQQFMQLFISSLPKMTGMSVSDSTIESVVRHQYQVNHISLLPSLSSTQKQIDVLIDMGLLLPKRSHHSHASLTSSSTSSYWFTLPGMGTVTRDIAQKRSRLLLKIRRSRYKEIKRSVLEQQNEDGIFFVRDLLSRGDIRIHKTPSGEEFLRL